jgi:cysteine-rich repeat protein
MASACRRLVIRIWMVLGIVLLAATIVPPEGAAQESKKQCSKRCKKEEKGCRKGFKGQFKVASKACDKNDKACKKTAKKDRKRNEKRCKKALKPCAKCCKKTEGECAVRVCGDGVRVAGEGCDGGASNSDTTPDACRTSCAVAGCGDGVIDAGEECDPPGGSCDASCLAVSVTTTTTTTTTSTTIPCGNGLVDPGEECDDGNVIEVDGCTTGCTECGNALVTEPETCDDGNLVDNDGCDSNCQPSGCGNGIRLPPETCDDGNLEDNDDCPGDCIIDECEPVRGTDLPVNVNVNSGNTVAGLTVLLIYPEGKVSIPGSGGDVGQGAIDEVVGFFSQSNDFDHALRQVITDISPIPDGRMFRIHFETCTGAQAPGAGEFECRVIAAADELGQPLDPAAVSCSVSGLP